MNDQQQDKDLRTTLLDMIIEPDAFNHPRAEIEPLQLKAANAHFAKLKDRIPILKRRAEEENITEIKDFSDLVPLLFSHTNYKSYPEVLLRTGKWERLCAWLNTLAGSDVTDKDVSGVKDVDEWIRRLGEQGVPILATSGTTGKCSFLPATDEDVKLKKRHFKHVMGWPYKVATNDRSVFISGPIEGPNSAIEFGQFARDLWSKPDAFFNLTKVPLRISEVSKAAQLKQAILEGRASQEEMDAANEAAAQSAKRAAKELDEFIDQLLAHRHEPVFVNGLWAQQMLIIERARELGIPDGDFHPDSCILVGGGVKNVSLPLDYKEQVKRFYGDVHHLGVYGMTELTQLMPRCEAGRYHRPPGLIWLQLNEQADKLINADEGIVEGRFAFMDLLLTGRWGGLITGDKVQIDWSETCACGRPGPTILDTIERFSQSGAEDHIGCAGTIDSYVRGAMG